MTEPTMPELAPCPFCGEPAELTRDSDHHGEWFNLGCSQHWHRVDPDKACPAGLLWYTAEPEGEAKAIAAWNRRALPADPPAEWIEAMRAEFLKSLETVSAVDLSEEETGEVKLYGGCTPATNYVTIDINDALEAAYAALAQDPVSGWRTLEDGSRVYVDTDHLSRPGTPDHIEEAVDRLRHTATFDFTEAEERAFWSIVDGLRTAREALEWYASDGGGDRFQIIDDKGEVIANFADFTSRAKAALARIDAALQPTDSKGDE